MHGESAREDNGCTAHLLYQQTRSSLAHATGSSTGSSTMDAAITFSLQRITISIRNKLRFLQGAPSVAMQEIPPDLQGLLADEDQTPDEKDKERGTARAGQRRRDLTMARNEFFDGDNDVDHDDGPSSSTARIILGEREGLDKAKIVEGQEGKLLNPPPTKMGKMMLMTLLLHQLGEEGLVEVGHEDE